MLINPETTTATAAAQRPRSGVTNCSSSQTATKRPTRMAVYTTTGPTPLAFALTR